MATPRKYVDIPKASGAVTPADKGHAARRIDRYASNNNPQMIVNLARKYSVRAMTVLVQMMEGKRVRTGPGSTGEEEEWDLPPAVRLRAAEIVLERGFGKTPQALLVKDETPAGGLAAVPIMQRVEAIRQAALQITQTHDLEASQLTETPGAQSTQEDRSAALEVVEAVFTESARTTSASPTPSPPAPTLDPYDGV